MPMLPLIPKPPSSYRHRLCTLLVWNFLLLLTSSALSAETRRISIYAPQASYEADIVVHDAIDYVGVTDLLEPLGHVDSRVEGHRLVLVFNGTAADFEDGKRNWRTAANPRLELTGNFILLDGRGYIPLASLTQLLSRLAGLATDYHSNSRRLFVGGTPMHFTSELRHSPTRLVLLFPAPVHPSIQADKSRVRLLFRREPLVTSAGSELASYDDPFLAGTNFSEVPNGALFTASLRQPATVLQADGGRTIIIQPATVATPPNAAPFSTSETTGTPAATPSSPIPAPPSTSSSSAAAGTNSGNSSGGQNPAVKSRPFVILDAAHGGSEAGAALTDSLAEKNFTLSLARRMQKDLEARGVSVVLTRNSDTQLSFDQRAVAANTSHASLYVALHGATLGHGIRIYTAMLAAGKPGMPAPAAPSNSVATSSAQTSTVPSAAGTPAPNRRSFLPWQSAQSPFVERSQAAATALLQSCETATIPASRSTAPLPPLQSLTLAAIVVEVAPLGSTAEEMSSASYQQKIAAALAAGIAAAREKLEAMP